MTISLWKSTRAWQESMAGARAAAPILLGVIPYAMLTGVVAVEAGLSKLNAIGMSLIIFAGASQLVVVQLLHAGAAAALILLTATVINMRFTLYSLSLAPHLNHLPSYWRWPLAYMLSDQAYAVAITHFREGADVLTRHWYYFGAALAFWLTWQVSAIAGVWLGASIPQDWSLEFTVPLAFLVLLVPMISDRATLAAAMAGGLSAAATAFIPHHLGLIAAALVGVGAGLCVETQSQRQTRPSDQQ